MCVGGGVYKTAWFLQQLMFILRHSLLWSPVFFLSVFILYSVCNNTYGFPVLLPGISTRHPARRYILKYDGLLTVDECAYIAECCIQVCIFNPLNPELNPTCYLPALLGAHYFLHFSRIRVKSLTFRLLSYIYIYIYIYIWSTHS